MLRGQSVLGQKHILHKYANANSNASALTIHKMQPCNVTVAVTNLIQKASYKQVDSLTMTNVFSKTLFILLLRHDSNWPERERFCASVR